MSAEYIITSTFMVSVVYVRVVLSMVSVVYVYIPPSLEEKFLQCCQRTAFRKLLFLFCQIQFLSEFFELL